MMDGTICLYLQRYVNCRYKLRVNCRFIPDIRLNFSLDQYLSSTRISQRLTSVVCLSSPPFFAPANWSRLILHRSFVRSFKNLVPLVHVFSSDKLTINFRENEGNNSTSYAKLQMIKLIDSNSLRTDKSLDGEIPLRISSPYFISPRIKLIFVIPERLVTLLYDITYNANLDPSIERNPNAFRINSAKFSLSIHPRWDG